MPGRPSAADLRCGYVALVFRTIIVDRAGGVTWCRPILAEVVGTAADGTAILLTANRTHLRFPVDALHGVTEGIAEALKDCAGISRAIKSFAVADFSHVGGQELIWDLHDAAKRATLRHLTADEIAEALAEGDAVVDADA